MKTILLWQSLPSCSLPPSFAQTKFSNKRNQREVEREIRQLTRQWDRAIVKRDIQFLDGILSDEYVISTMTKPQYLELIKSSQAKGQEALLLGKAT